jgi:phosphoglycerate dehydrogenase-like enzyme
MRILFCHPVDPRLLPTHEVVTCKPHELADHLDGVDVVFPGVPATGAAVVDLAILGKGTFGLVHHEAVGFETTDVKAATERGIWVAHIPGNLSGNDVSVAEHAVFLALAISRRLHEAEAAVAAKKSGVPMGSVLFGRTACIIGLGNIGRRLAERLQAFGMTLVGVSPTPVRIDGVSMKSIEPPVNLLAAVAGADYVFVCASGDKSNSGLIDGRVLSAMKPGAFLVNVARGSLVEPSALLVALQNGHLGGAGLDVFVDEPVDPADPLLAQPNVVATPHIAGATNLNAARSLAIIVRNLDAYARGDRFQGLVNEPARPRHPLVNRSA